MNKGPKTKGPFNVDAGVVKMINRMFSMVFQQKNGATATGATL